MGGGWLSKEALVGDNGKGSKEVATQCKTGLLARGAIFAASLTASRAEGVSVTSTEVQRAA